MPHLTHPEAPEAAALLAACEHLSGTLSHEEPQVLEAAHAARDVARLVHELEAMSGRLDSWLQRPPTPALSPEEHERLAFWLHRLQEGASRFAAATVPASGDDPTVPFLGYNFASTPTERQREEVVKAQAQVLQERVPGLRKPEALELARHALVGLVKRRGFIERVAPARATVDHAKLLVKVREMQPHRETIRDIYEAMSRYFDEEEPEVTWPMLWAWHCGHR